MVTLEFAERPCSTVRELDHWRHFWERFSGIVGRGASPHTPAPRPTPISPDLRANVAYANLSARRNTCGADAHLHAGNRRAAKGQADFDCPPYCDSVGWGTTTHKSGQSMARSHWRLSAQSGDSGFLIVGRNAVVRGEFLAYPGVWCLQ